MAVKRARPLTRAATRRFYAEALDQAEMQDLDLAEQVDGIDQEIAVLRLKLRQAILERPEDLQLMFKGVHLLASTLATRYRLNKNSQRELSADISNALRSLQSLWPEEDTRGAP